MTLKGGCRQVHYWHIQQLLSLPIGSQQSPAGGTWHQSHVRLVRSAISDRRYLDTVYASARWIHVAATSHRELRCCTLDGDCIHRRAVHRRGLRRQLGHVRRTISAGGSSPRNAQPHSSLRRNARTAYQIDQAIMATTSSALVTKLTTR